MRYKKFLATRHFGIRINTNNKMLLELISNNLDFSVRSVAKPGIIIDFFIEDNPTKDVKDYRNTIQSGWAFKNDKFYSSCGLRIANVLIEPALRKIRVRIYKSYMEHIEYFLSSFFFQPLCILLAHQELFAMHASCCEKDGSCVLFSGAQNSGKSTLALTLARRGFRLLADDDCFIKIKKESAFILPFPTKIGFNLKMAGKFKDLKKHMVKGYAYGGKPRLSMRHLYGQVLKQGYRCISIIFPEYCSQGQFSFKEIERETALGLLLKENVHGLLKESSQLAISCASALSTLIKDARCYRLRYNDSLLDRVSAAIQNIYDSISKGKIK